MNRDPSGASAAGSSRRSTAPAVPSAAAAEHLQFEWDGDRYALPLAWVREVAAVRGAERPAGIGGEPVRLASFGAFVGFGDLSPLRSRPAIVIASGANVGGLLVDRVAGVTSIPETSLLPLPDRFGASSRTFIRGLAWTDDRVTVVLEPGAIADSLFLNQDGTLPTG